VLLVVGAAFALVAVAILLAVVLTRGNSSSSSANVPARGTLANALPGAADVHRLLNGIPQQGTTLGKASAPVTMVEYIDLQCPYCQQFETTAMPTIVRRLVRTGKLRVVARPLAFIGPDSVRGRDAAIAAGMQGRFFDFAQVLYANQGEENTGWLSDDMVKAAAASIPGLDVPKLLRDRGSSTVADGERSIDAQATADGVHRTPTILVGRTGAKPRQVALASPSDAQSVERAIAAAGG
jgi:protein-disulfide isomerase